jgi:hypothetical protein
MSEPLFVVHSCTETVADTAAVHLQFSARGQRLSCSAISSVPLRPRVSADEQQALVAELYGVALSYAFSVATNRQCGPSADVLARLRVAVTVGEAL